MANGFIIIAKEPQATVFSQMRYPTQEEAEAYVRNTLFKKGEEQDYYIAHIDNLIPVDRHPKRRWVQLDVVFVNQQEYPRQLKTLDITLYGRTFSQRVYRVFNFTIFNVPIKVFTESWLHKVWECQAPPIALLVPSSVIGDAESDFDRMEYPSHTALDLFAEIPYTTVSHHPGNLYYKSSKPE